MKIGILTWHSQLNYGGVLQCWALQTALERMGHKAVVIDRWLDKRNQSLLGEYARWGKRKKLKLFVRGLLGCGDFGLYARHKNTLRFISKDLHRTTYHFFEWNEAPESLGVDLIVVGSDQLWHCNPWTRHDVYLLENAPSLPAITYAMSFGRPDIPKEFMGQFKSGLKRFSAISVRERQAVELVESCGSHATHVADPTILVNPQDVFARFGRPVHGAKKTVLCYFLSQSIFEVLPDLREFAKLQRCRVEIYVDVLYNKSLLPIPRGGAAIARRLAAMLEDRLGRITIVRHAGPNEFVSGLSKADAVITDSFHGLMFSAIYGKNIRVLRPQSEFRKLIFGRIEEFVAKYVNGSCLADSVQAALKSIANDPSTVFDAAALQCFRDESENWLRGAITEAMRQ